MSNSNGGILILLALYFLPGIVASARYHHNRTAIFVMNLLLGWTCLGWIAALVWSCTAVAPSDRAATPFATPVKDDPRWANLRSTPITRVSASDRSFYIGMSCWAGALLVVGITIIANVK